MTLSVAVTAIGHVHVAFVVDGETVRVIEHPGTEALEHPPRSIKLHHSRKVRFRTSRAVVVTASFQNPQALLIGVHLDAGRGTPGPSTRQPSPVVVGMIREEFGA